MAQLLAKAEWASRLSKAARGEVESGEAWGNADQQLVTHARASKTEEQTLFVGLAHPLKDRPREIATQLDDDRPELTEGQVHVPSA